jgi:hypothetical protein
MKLFANFKLLVARWVLNRQRKTRHRNKKVFNLRTARTIGIVYDASSTNHFEAVVEFAKDLSKRKLSVEILGYVKARDIPDNYLFKKGHAYFIKKDVNWYYRTRNPDALKFMNQKHDILIDLHLTRNFIFDYIVGMSLARFKVGRYRDVPNYYDLMIQVSEEPTFEYFIQQVQYYLDMINRPELTPHFQNV